MRSLLLTALVGALLVGTAGAAPSQGKGKGSKTPEQVFQKRDKDGDGQLTVKELQGKKPEAARAEKRLRKLDKDGDGKVSLAEFKAAPKKKKTSS